MAHQFKQQLDSLMSVLQKTEPHFIRCIKSNHQQRPRVFQGALCLRQLKYAGLFEALRIRRAGYEVRIPHRDFFQRFQVCSPNPKDPRPNIEGMTPAHLVAECKGMVARLAAKGQMSAAECQVGKTRVFLKSNKTRAAFEQLRLESLVSFITTLQAFGALLTPLSPLNNNILPP